MQGLGGLSLKVLFLFLLSDFALAGELVSFPTKTRVHQCNKFLSNGYKTTRTRYDAEIVNLDSYRSEYISPKSFFELYPIGPTILALAPRSITDFNPVFSSRNFSNWKALNQNFVFSAKQESYVLIGLQSRSDQVSYRTDAFATGAAAEYKIIMSDYAPKHHTTFVIPNTYRLLLSAIEHIRASSGYLMNENTAATDALRINYGVVFTRQDSVKYGARDFVSSWVTRNSQERNFQEFLIRLIDEKIKPNEELVFEKMMTQEILKELHNSFKNSQEVTSSLYHLESEFMGILRLSQVDNFL